MKLTIPSWLDIDPRAFAVSEPTIVSTSGGLTSGLMAALYAHFGARVEFCFWNTGREADGTYDFLRRLGDCIPLRFFEVRKPLNYGDPPKMMTFEEVSFGRLDRTGEPFRQFLETLAEFREVAKGKGPIGPNPVQRLCTAYMKAKVSDRVADYLFGEDVVWTSAVGLRHDEPRRIAKMSARDTARKSSVAPLNEAKISKCHVEMFWKEQPFTLDIPPHQGNCTLCFLKDEADIADIIASEPDPDGMNWEWWKRLDDQFQIRGRGSASYRQIEAEIPMRLAIRDSLVNIKPLPQNEGWDRRRFKLILRQEERIIREGRKHVPCSCESAEQVTDDYVLSAQDCLF